MRKAILVIVVATFSLVPINHAQQADESAGQAATAGRLPVKRVVLYKNGVGYFEHSTRVHGTQDLNIDFTSAQLNDALKSLTVVDLGDGHINGVRFNSVAPLSERLKTLRLPLGEEASRTDLLEALRGTPVEIHSGSTGATGKVLGLDVTKRFGSSPNQMEEVTVLTLVTDEGEVRSFDLSPTTTVRIADPELAGEVNRYLNLIGSAKAADLRRLTISDTGSGDREIFVSYISEVPVWKSTYRILLDDKHAEKPLVQGWAIVDNTIGEDWKDVQLSLVAGAPQSFVQNISQPMYVRRPEVALPAEAMLTPQTFESAMNEAAPPEAAAPPPPPPPPGAGPQFSRLDLYGKTFTPPGAGGGVGHGYGTSNGGPLRRMQTDQITGQAPEVERETAELSTVAEGQKVETEAKSVGDFFEYALQQRVTIGKNQSALVPMLQARMDAQKVTVWNEESDEPLRALWLNNTSGVELDAGSFNILDEGNFSGEGMLDAVRPGEKRLISYAADPAVRIKLAVDPTEKPFSRIRIIKGAMIMSKEEREKRTYTISNSDSAPREVIIEHSIRDEWKLADGAKPEEQTASLYRFRVNVEPRTGGQLVIEEYHPLETRLELSDVSTEEVKLITDQSRMTPALQQAIMQVLDQKQVVANLGEQIKARDADVRAIGDDQVRIRENMKALKGSVEERALVQRYTRQLDQQEDRLAALGTQIAALQSKRQQADDQLDKLINGISLDERF
jgi:hypothetical protein